MNKYDFIRTDVVFDWYKKGWKGGVIAVDCHSQLNYGDVPWTMMANLGGSYRMRGYYEGRYRSRERIPRFRQFQIFPYPAEFRHRLPLGIQKKG